MTLEKIEEHITEADDTIRAVSKSTGRIARDRAHHTDGKGRVNKTELRKTLQANGLKRDEVNQALDAVFGANKDKTKTNNDRSKTRNGGGPGGKGGSGGTVKHTWNHSASKFMA